MDTEYDCGGVSYARLEQAIGRPHIWNIVTLWVDEDFRQLGVATALLKVICRQADMQGIQLWLTAQALMDGGLSDLQLRGFYHKRGFEGGEKGGYMIRQPRPF
jgi:GNAT superfamily N-acetyltransferase